MAEMDVQTASSVGKKEQAAPSIGSALVSAVLEWLLICMLFIGGMFSYLVTKFARHSKLQVPCLFCSRLDHVLEKERGGFCWDLVCKNHKSKISSSIFCQLHNKLVDVHEVCESCFFSFATLNKSNSETYRLLVGKLGEEPHPGLSQVEDDNLDSSCTRKCLCCNAQWTSRSYTQTLIQTKSIDSEVNVIDGSVNDDLVREMEIPEIDSVAKNTTIEPQIITLVDSSPDSTKLINPTHDSHLETEDITKSFSEEPLKHGLEELKWQPAEHTNSVSVPSELISFDDAHPYSKIDETQVDLKETIVTNTSKLEKEPSTEQDKAPAIESDTRGPAKLVKEVTAECAETSDAPIVTSTSEREKEISTVQKAPALESDTRGPLELVKDVAEECAEASDAQIVTSTSEPEKEISTDQIQEEAPALKSDIRGPTELVKDVAAERVEISDAQNNSISETYRAERESIRENDIPVDSKPIKTEISSQLDLGDAYKLALGTKGRQLSGRFLENQRSMSDSTKAFEDLKVLLTQISANGDISPRLSPIYDDYKSMESPTYMGMQMFQRKISLERNESNLSLDGSTISEIEGESSVDRLKRQLEHDKKVMSALYKELEEERNASAIAANQAMAMITRLQEEKAALNMEALQFLRMMEEQAEYDGEALQRTNEMLTEKEKQVQDLEYELEQYKNQSEDASYTFVKPSSEWEGEPEADKLQPDCLESETSAFQNVEK